MEEIKELQNMNALYSEGRRIHHLEEINPLKDVTIKLPKGVEYPISETVKLFIFYKPKFLICEKEDKRKVNPWPTIFDYIQSEHKDKESYFLIGRLDYNASGILLLTNNVMLKNIITELSIKEYEYTFKLKVNGEITPEKLTKIQHG